MAVGWAQANLWVAQKQRSERPGAEKTKISLVICNIPYEVHTLDSLHCTLQPCHAGNEQVLVGLGQILDPGCRYRVPGRNAGDLRPNGFFGLEETSRTEEPEVGSVPGEPEAHESE